MRVAILITDPNHPIIPKLRQWQDAMARIDHAVVLVFDKKHIPCSDVLFLVSCSQIITLEDLKKIKVALVLHASELPKNKGWSPHIWSILEGENEITVSLIEASHPVDSGAIWLQAKFNLIGHELLPEINEKLFTAEIDLMTQAIEHYNTIVPCAQSADVASYLRRRTPEDSCLDISKTIEEQFNLLRVVDNERFPAFFDHKGHRYVLKIEKK